MSRYLLRKVVLYVLTFFVAVSVDWAIPRLMPGDPISGLLARLQADPTAAEELQGYFTKSFGLDRPLWQQYLDFWRGLVQGDLGPSIAYVGSSVSDLLWAAVPYTLALLAAGDRLQLHRREPRRRARGAAEGARQHRAAGLVPADRDAVHVARARARVLRRLQVGAPPRLGRIRLLPAARMELGVRPQLR